MIYKIAIDGPSGAGKSTLSKALAEEFGTTYVDTGAIYRTVGLFVLQNNANPRDEAAVSALLPEINIEIKHINGEQRIFLSGKDVSGDIRSELASKYASDVSALLPVRQFLLELQRSFAKRQSVIMDGRDIGTVVLPDAEVKIFLTATPEDRAQRRFLEQREKGVNVDYETVLKNITERDKNDSSRAHAPLEPAPDAVIVNTTGNTFEKSFGILKEIIDERLKNLV